VPRGTGDWRYSQRFRRTYWYRDMLLWAIDDIPAKELAGHPRVWFRIGDELSAPADRVTPTGPNLMNEVKGKSALAPSHDLGAHYHNEFVSMDKIRLAGTAKRSRPMKHASVDKFRPRTLKRTAAIAGRLTTIPASAGSSSSLVTGRSSMFHRVSNGDQTQHTAKAARKAAPSVEFRGYRRRDSSPSTDAIRHPARRRSCRCPCAD
jgi:hypothetical protein